MRCGAVRFKGREGCANVRTKRKKQAVARRGGRDQMDGSGEFRQKSSLRRVDNVEVCWAVRRERGARVQS